MSQLEPVELLESDDTEDEISADHLTKDQMDMVAQLIQIFNCDYITSLSALAENGFNIQQASSFLSPHDANTDPKTRLQKRTSSLKEQLFKNDVLDDDLDDEVQFRGTSNQVARHEEIFIATSKIRKGPAATITYDDIARPTNAADNSGLKMKLDYQKRPIWVCRDRRIILEAKSRYYKEASDFLVAISEPKSRTRMMHEYLLSSESLYAAVSTGLLPEDIVSVLEKLSKSELPEEVSAFIRKTTVNFGKAKLVLKRNCRYIESASKDTLATLLRHKTIIGCVVQGSEYERSDAVQENDQLIKDLKTFPIEELDEEDLDRDDENFLLGRSSSPVDNATLIPLVKNPSYVYSFQVDSSKIDVVRQAANDIDYPLVEEYDFRRDNVSESLAIDLKPETVIRPYQERSLVKMFGNGRARSGIVVLPCGAGKTLTGIIALCTMRKSCVILCTGTVAAEQWYRQLLQFARVSKPDIRLMTSKSKTDLPNRPEKAYILITTYSMMAISKERRSKLTQRCLNAISNKEWGLMILDEVHVAPAKLFRKVLSNLHAQCKLGLTATLVREDDLIKDLNFLIGPKLYEANWLDLTDQGYLARVACTEVPCAMTKEFFIEYLGSEKSGQKQLMYTLNPNKILVAQHLIGQHEARGDKILVFCDNLFAIVILKDFLNRPALTGSSSASERTRIFQQFCKSTELNTIIVSKIGDIAIDLPEANVIIQVSSHFGSRRQEAQRLGRILRPTGERSKVDEFDSYFYSLVSSGTTEERYAAKRRQYLIDQGYSYKVAADVLQTARISSEYDRIISRETHIELLSKIISQQDEKEASSSSSEDTKESEAGSSSEEELIPRQIAKRRKVNSEVISGAGTLKYEEYMDGDIPSSMLQPDAKSEYIEKFDVIAVSDNSDVAENIEMINEPDDDDDIDSFKTSRQHKRQKYLGDDDSDSSVEVVEPVRHLSDDGELTESSSEDEQSVDMSSSDERYSKLSPAKQIRNQILLLYRNMGWSISRWPDFRKRHAAFLATLDNCVYLNEDGEKKVDKNLLQRIFSKQFENQ